MNPSELLPGLGEILEHRLGRVGYHLTTIVALAVALFLILLPIATIVATWNALDGPINTNIAVLVLGLLLVVVLLVVVVLAGVWVFNRIKKGGLSATVFVNKRPAQLQDTKVDIVSFPQHHSDQAESFYVQELTALVPLVERQIVARRPNTFAKTVMGHMIWSLPSDTRADYLELLARLNAMGVPYPTNKALDEEWFVFLVELQVLAKTGNLNKARALYTETDLSEHTEIA